MVSIEPRKAIRVLHSAAPSSVDRQGMIRLDMNENTSGAAPTLVRNLKEGITGRRLGTYPDYEAARAKLARHVDLSPKELLLTNGIDDAIKLICDAFVDPGDTLLIPSLTFPMYQFFHSVAGGRTEVLRYDENLRFPVERALATLKRGRVRWLALANPNNPTGTLIAQDDLKAMLKAAPGTLVLADEAYFDYCGETVLPWIRRFPNLLVARTFSKAYGLAGLRLGLLFARTELVVWMRRAQAVFPVNSLAVAAGLKAIRRPRDVAMHVREVFLNRHRLCGCLDSLGIPYASSSANFVFACVGARGPEIARRLAAQRILVRHWSDDPMLRPYFRIGIGTRTETSRLIRVLEGLRNLIEPQDPVLAWRRAAQYSPVQVRIRSG